jgi:hypothetical protein
LFFAEQTIPSRKDTGTVAGYQKAEDGRQKAEASTGGGLRANPPRHDCPNQRQISSEFSVVKVLKKKQQGFNEPAPQTHICGMALCS